MLQPKFISIPSLIEAYPVNLTNVASNIENGLQIYDNGQNYIIGNLALEQGISPYRNINSSPGENDYQLLAKAGILVGTGGKTGEYTLTTGFPFSTYEFYKQKAMDFFSSKDITIDFNTGTYSSGDRKKSQYSIKRVDILPEIQGSVTAIRKGYIGDSSNFFIVSLGYGTFEVALSTDTGLLARTCQSANGLRTAVNNLYRELSRIQNVGLKNEHQMNQSFQYGKIAIGRERKDLTELRKKYLQNYYQEIVSPTIRKAFTDGDYEKASSLYIVGGGAMYPDLVKCFEDEFSEFLSVIVPQDPSTMASYGYFLNSCLWTGDKESALGIDIGNAYTVVAKINSDHSTGTSFPIFSESEK
jgi:plasmid segregation protein ParM